jgi:tRNA dimethylallyltransferase
VTPQDAKALIIAGPTASGKSEAAIRLAERTGGVILCADSMQVYRDLRIVTARPSEADEARAPHRLYGHVDGSERYSAGRFASDIKLALTDAAQAGTTPIICGGTGLYLKALTEGLSPIPEILSDTTDRLSAEWDADPGGFRGRLVARDPGAASLMPADRQRHIRAASVLEATGRSLSSWQEAPKRPILEGYRAALLIPERETLYARCEARFEGMLAEGALEEVRTLLRRRLSPSLPVMKALGVPELRDVIEGRASLEEAAAAARQETRRFAKRQMTWFRNQTAWTAFENAGALADFLASGA